MTVALIESLTEKDVRIGDDTRSRRERRDWGRGERIETRSRSYVQFQ